MPLTSFPRNQKRAPPKHPRELGPNHTGVPLDQAVANDPDAVALRALYESTGGAKIWSSNLGWNMSKGPTVSPCARSYACVLVTS